MPASDLTENYAKAFAGHLEPGQTPALLLVDMVEAYLRADSPLYCETAAAAVEHAASLLDAARAAGRQVVFTNVAYEPGGADGGLFYRKTPVLRVFELGSPLGEFPDALQPRDGEWVVTKQYPSAFFATGLADRLRDAGVDTLVVAGFSTSGCVRASALDALQYGFAPFVVRDACADRHEAPHEANLFDLQAKYAEVVDEKSGREVLMAESSDTGS